MSGDSLEFFKFYFIKFGLINFGFSNWFFKLRSIKISFFILIFAILIKHPNLDAGIYFQEFNFQALPELEVR